MEVSIIVATLNYAHFLPELFHSLENQSHDDWECLVIDDGSTDNTKQILEDWVLKDSRIKYFYSTKSKGPSYARNIGIQKAKGDFILFLDADDIIEPEKLSSHVRGFEKDRYVDIIYGEVRYFKENDKENLRYSLKPENKPWIPQFYGDGFNMIFHIIKH